MAQSWPSAHFEKSFELDGTNLNYDDPNNSFVYAEYNISQPGHQISSDMDQYYNCYDSSHNIMTYENQFPISQPGHQILSNRDQYTGYEISHNMTYENPITDSYEHSYSYSNFRNNQQPTFNNPAPNFRTNNLQIPSFQNAQFQPLLTPSKSQSQHLRVANPPPGLPPINHNINQSHNHTQPPTHNPPSYQARQDLDKYGYHTSNKEHRKRSRNDSDEKKEVQHQDGNINHDDNVPPINSTDDSHILAEAEPKKTNIAPYSYKMAEFLVKHPKLSFSVKSDDCPESSEPAIPSFNGQTIPNSNNPCKFSSEGPPQPAIRGPIKTSAISSGSTKPLPMELLNLFSKGQKIPNSNNPIKFTDKGPAQPAIRGLKPFDRSKYCPTCNKMLSSKEDLERHTFENKELHMMLTHDWWSKHPHPGDDLPSAEELWCIICQYSLTSGFKNVALKGHLQGKRHTSNLLRWKKTFDKMPLHEWCIFSDMDQNVFNKTVIQPKIPSYFAKKLNVNY